MKIFKVAMLGLIVLIALPMTAKAQNTDPEGIRTLKEAVDVLSSTNQDISESLSKYIDEKTSNLTTGSASEQQAKQEENTKLLMDSAHALDAAHD